MKAIICPSMLSCDFARLKEESERMIAAGADWLHMDVMDGHFVPNLTLGAPIIGCLRKHFPRDLGVYLDCHLMVSDPNKWVEDFQKAGANQFTFHIEAIKGFEQLDQQFYSNVRTIVQSVRQAGMDCGIAVKPKTSVDILFPLLDAPVSGGSSPADKKARVECGGVNMVLIMTVEPGFGGQSFMADMMEKVQTLRQKYNSLPIQVDGGVSVDTIATCADAGANIIVSGSGVFKHKSPQQAIEMMRNAVNDKLNA